MNNYNDSPHEECGIFGISLAKKQAAAGIVYHGLYALQHRGQESCGIIVNHSGLFTAKKDLGLVSEVFTPEVLSSMPEGRMAVGHVRYATTGAARRANCQPLEVNHLKGRLALAHNGNLSNAAELRRELELSGAIFHTTSDTETIAYLITRERLRQPSIEEAVEQTMYRIEGAYSLVLMSAQKLIAVRDPHGFRPLCYGTLSSGEGFVVASESCALDAVGARFVRDLLPGEMLVFTRDRVESRQLHCGRSTKRGRKRDVCSGSAAPLRRTCASARRTPVWTRPSAFRRLRASPMRSVSSKTSTSAAPSSRRDRKTGSIRYRSN